MTGSIIASIIGAVLFAVGTAAWSWLHGRRVLKRIRTLRSLFGGIPSTYVDAREAIPDIERDAANSLDIRYLGDYNTTLLGERLPPETLLYRILAQRRVDQRDRTSVRLLHLCPHSPFAETRAAELSLPVDAIRDSADSAARTIGFVLSALGLPDEVAELRHHRFPLVFRVILLDHCAYLGFYRSERFGRDSPHIRVPRSSEFYDVSSRLFDALWKHFSHEPEDD